MVSPSNLSPVMTTLSLEMDGVRTMKVQVYSKEMAMLTTSHAVMSVEQMERILQCTVHQMDYALKNCYYI